MTLRRLYQLQFASCWIFRGILSFYRLSSTQRYLISRYIVFYFKVKPLCLYALFLREYVLPVTIKVGDKVEGKSKKLSGKKGIITKITKESHARKFTIYWDTGGTSIESARGISKTGGGTPPCKKQKRTPLSLLVVESEERPGSDSDTDDDGTSEAEEEKEDSVQREDINCKTWKKDIGMLMAENG